MALLAIVGSRALSASEPALSVLAPALSALEPALSAFEGAAARALQSPAIRQSPAISGRVVDLATGDGVEGAVVSLVRLAGVRREEADSARAEARTTRRSPARTAVETVSGPAGQFRFAEARAGEYEVEVEHVAYGAFVDTLVLAEGERIALRVVLSQTAIALEPLVVEAVGAETRRARAQGTALRRLTAEQLAPVARTGVHLVDALARLMPGMRARSGRSQPGQLVCLEFRSPASLSDFGCLAPVVVVDNVRQANGTITLNTLPIEDVRSVEAVPPGEAGVRYGADSRYGVVVIETWSRAPTAEGSGRLPGALYDWSLESEPYPWARVLGAAAASNAAGLLVGYAVSRSCLDFDDLTRHFSGAQCGFWGNSGARLMLYVVPQTGTGWAASRAGATDLSRGSPWKNAVAAAVMALPGMVLALTSDEDGFAGSKALGLAMASVGAPAAAALADRLFRRTVR